ncbi:MAG: GntR family transcriptional regulator [Oscillospiraceae bacterium]|nr:GntR family transcriptional regulator [Oscillospiraceae bacterium]
MKKDSLTNKAYLQIKEMIISNLLEPGEIINEAALQELLHIGRTPIHEALLRLSVEQFVTIIPRKGIEICKFSPKIVHAIFNARLIIEPNTLRRTHSMLDVDWLIKMRKNFAAINENKTLSDMDGLREYIRFDTEFHSTIVTVLDNPYLSTLVDNYMNQITAITIAVTKLSNHSYTANEDHLLVIDHILAGNVEEACTALEDHICRCHVDVINTYLTAY